MPTKKSAHPRKRGSITRRPSGPGAIEGNPPAPAAVTGVQAMAEYRLADAMAQLEALVRRGELAEAGELVRGMEQRWPGDEPVQKFARVLAPPAVSVRQGSPARSRSRECQWLREHAHEYPGSWLAVLGERLVAAHADVRVVIAAVKKDPTAKDALLHFQPGG